MWIKALTNSMCIFFLLILAVTNLVDGHHHRLLQDYGDVSDNTGDVYEEDNHFHIFNIFKRDDIVIYGPLSIVFLITVPFFLYLFIRMRHSKKDEPSSQPNSDVVHQNISAHVQ